MRILVLLAFAACSTSDAEYPDLELLGSHIVASQGHIASLALDVRLSGPYEIGGQVKVRDVSFVDEVADGQGNSLLYTPLAMVPSDAHWPADGAITLVDDASDVAAVTGHCGHAKLFLAVGAAARGDGHIEATELVANDVPVTCD